MKPKLMEEIALQKAENTAFSKTRKESGIEGKGTKDQIKLSRDIHEIVQRSKR